MTDKIAKSISDMVIEYVEGGIRGGTDWRNGLETIISRRLNRLAAPSSDNVMPTIEDCHKMAAQVGMRFVPYAIGGPDAPNTVRADGQSYVVGVTPASALPTSTETGWVIERGDSPPSAPTYWAGDDRWSEDHMDAIRFARKWDGERVSARLFYPNNRVCEHVWSGGTQ